MGRGRAARADGGAGAGCVRAAGAEGRGAGSAQAAGAVGGSRCGLAGCRSCGTCSSRCRPSPRPCCSCLRHPLRETRACVLTAGNSDSLADTSVGRPHNAPEVQPFSLKMPLPMPPPALGRHRPSRTLSSVPGPESCGAPAHTRTCLHTVSPAGSEPHSLKGSSLPAGGAGPPLPGRWPPATRTGEYLKCE